MNFYHSPFDYLKQLLRQKSALSLLIMANVVVFIIINIISLFFFLYQINPENNQNVGISKIIGWLAVPSNLHLLSLKPWTILSYMFLQENILHLLINLLVLYFSGKIFLEYLNELQLLLTYLLGGIFGALLYITSYNVFPAFHDSLPYSVALGSSASVLAILIAIAAYVPNYQVNFMFIGKLKLKYIAITFVLLDILYIEKENPGGHIAHLGGALWGFSYINIFIKNLTFNKNSKKFNFKNLSKYFNFKKRSHFKGVYSNKRPLTDEEYNFIKAQRQKKIDKILDKISKSGYSSLTKEEKELLFKNSNNS